MTDDERNELLVEMTDAVADQVLYGSYTQTQAMSLAAGQSVSMVGRPRPADPAARAGGGAGPGDRGPALARRR